MQMFTFYFPLSQKNLYPEHFTNKKQRSLRLVCFYFNGKIELNEKHVYLEGRPGEHRWRLAGPGSQIPPGT